MLAGGRVFRIAAPTLNTRQHPPAPNTRQHPPTHATGKPSQEQSEGNTKGAVVRVIAAITFIALAIALVSVVLKTYTPVPVKPTEDDGSSTFGDDAYFPVTDDNDDMTYAKVRVRRGQPHPRSPTIHPSGGHGLPLYRSLWRWYG